MKRRISRPHVKDCVCEECRRTDRILALQAARNAVVAAARKWKQACLAHNESDAEELIRLAVAIDELDELEKKPPSRETRRPEGA